LGVDDSVSIDSTEDTSYYLTVNNLERIEINGLGNIEIEE